VVREKKGSVRILELDSNNRDMLTETLLMSPISTNRQTQWDHLRYYPCTVDHTQLLHSAFFCLFSSLSHSSIHILFSLPHFARSASRKTELQKNYFTSFGTLSALQNTRAFWRFTHSFHRRLTVVNFPCTDWLSYLRTQLKAFVGRVCLRSRRFFSALFSQ